MGRLTGKRPLICRVATYIIAIGCLFSVGCHCRTLRGPKRQFEESLEKDETLKVIHFPSNYLPVVTQMYEGKTTERNIATAEELIPNFYKVIVAIEPNKELLSDDVIREICVAVSRVLHLPLDSVKVSKYEVSTGIIKLYFVYTVSKGSSDLMLLPASEVVPNLTIPKLQKETVLKILSIQSGEKIIPNGGPKRDTDIWGIFKDRNWKAWQLAIIISCGLFAIFCIAVVVVFLSNRHTPKENAELVEERQVVVQPVLKPDVSGINVIQPENKDCYITETDSEHTPSPSRSPMRIKGKGLLERRGSNASLTLDLNRSQENIQYGTPPKECSTEEYLLSAGHRLARQQLQNSLKDVKSLHTEFWEIPMNHPERVEVAGSGTKNRYKTILPNETTRVSLLDLDGDPLTAYVNANFIRGYASEQRAYIATQGPMAHTVNDFWTMVWEQRSPIIVMITKLKEKQKVKCEPYVPEYQGRFGDLTVAVLKILQRDGYVIRELLMSDGKKNHRVFHFWYTAWPDHKTPDTAKQLLDMAVEVEDLRHDNNGAVMGPTVVHCSAGIGRTGCFIAVSIGIQQLLEENIVDILGIVCGLRLDRGGMIQTAEQYEFVHQALSIFERSLPDHSGE